MGAGQGSITLDPAEVVPDVPRGGEILKTLGTKGDDRLEGDHGRDLIKGRKGDDQLYGHGGDDKLKGGSGRDYIYAHGGNDKIKGQKGDDNLSGSTGNDKINGGDGDDRLYGGAGDDKLKGGAGADTFYFRDMWGPNWIADNGDDVVKDFTPASRLSGREVAFEADLIDLDEHPEIDGYRDLFENHLEQRGGDTYLETEDGSMRLKGVAIGVVCGRGR